MGTRNPRVDAYIANAAEFAQPILRYLRDLVHQACPEVEEVMKWSFPNFTYKGMFCSMAAFKEHCSFGFWKSSLLPGPPERNGMGHFGRITSMKDLPPKKDLLNLIKEAKRLNDKGVSKPKPKASKAPKELVVPPYFLAAVKKNKKALASFEAFLQPQEGIRGMGDRGKGRRNSRPASLYDGGLARRRKVAQLEI
jgi:hypothetical protein